MIDLGWSAPERRVDAGTARRVILAQHARIRVLLEDAGKLAESALQGNVPQPETIAAAIGDIRTTMEIHLASEESLLLPLLRADLPVGPLRADRLLDEHRRQRATLLALESEAHAHPELPELAAKLTFLTDWLLADMAEEEASLLTDDVVRDDIVVIDQSSG
jgi:hemerythrin HHE cation binding domain-containing protein